MVTAFESLQPSLSINFSLAAVHADTQGKTFVDLEDTRLEASRHSDYKTGPLQHYINQDLRDHASGSNQVGPAVVRDCGAKAET